MMVRYQSGFTLIELMVVVTLILIVMTIAVPSLLSARLCANEAAALQTLRTICTAQAQFSRSAAADEDRDASGEFGTLAELAGSAGVRGGLRKAPTDLSPSMGKVNPDGEVERSGYVFRLYLPDQNGVGVPENGGGGISPGMLGADLAEGYWCCYAWPAKQGTTGRRTFFVDAGADILFTEAPDYSGTGCIAIRAGNAYQSSNGDSITGHIAVGTIGADGNIWRCAN